MDCQCGYACESTIADRYAGHDIDPKACVNEDLRGMIVVHAVVDGCHGGAGRWYHLIYEMRIHRD